MQDANRRRRHGWFAPSQEARQGGGREEDAKSRRHDQLREPVAARVDHARRAPARRAARDRALARGRDADAKLRGERTRERRERRGTGRTKRDATTRGRRRREAVATLATSNGDETRALLGETKSTGVAAPRRLTPKQTRVVEALVEAHGDDLSAMVMDGKRNAMQHSSGTLLKMTESYHYWREEAAAGGTTRVDFRAPKKSKLRGRA